MKYFTVSITVLAVILTAIWPASARDTKHILPIAAAMATKDAGEKLDGSVKFFFGKQEYPKVVTNLALTYPTVRPMRLRSLMKGSATGHFYRR